MTPNGDGVNDQLAFSFTLQGVTAADVEVSIYDLSGQLVRHLSAQTRREGRYRDVWDGTKDGALVVPGLYLARVSAVVDRGTFEQVTSVVVAY